MLEIKKKEEAYHKLSVSMQNKKKRETENSSKTRLVYVVYCIYNSENISINTFKFIFKLKNLIK